MRLFFILLFLFLAHPLQANNVEVVTAKAEQTGSGQYHIQVTLRHADTGWDHYANAWRVLAPDGTVLGERVLYHPHVNEQPFTRGLSGVKIPPETPFILIEGEDTKHGTSPQRFKIELN
ncbi:MAG: hypothetical protein OQL27_06745 [Sedimenticola sp.]|nr:hypothetical protein [Sedimenticola sp.]